MKTALYRHYDQNGVLLYVGISDHLSSRDRQHLAGSPWHKLVSKTETDWCVSRDHARALESVAIRYENPLHNVMHNDGAHVPDVTDYELPERDLVEKIRSYISITGKPKTTVGRESVNDRSLFDDLIAGRELRSKTRNAVLDYIAHPEGSPRLR